MKKLITLLKISVLTLCLVGLSACSDDSSNSEQNNRNKNAVIPSVEATQARFGSLPLVERFSGNVKAENQVTLYSEISGVVTEVYVQNGDFVEKGEPLLSLNTQVLEQELQQAKAGLKINQAQLKQAKANLARTQADFNRIKQLEEKDLTSQVEVEQAEAELLSAEADVELSEAQVEQTKSQVEQQEEELSKAVVRAPITGNIGRRNAEVGMQVNTGTQLFLIGDLSKLKIEIVLTENMLNSINVGQSARILVNENNQDEVLNGKVSRISPFLNEITRSTIAEIDVDNEDGLLRPGMFIPVDVLFGESEQATLIPTSALYNDPNSGQAGVFLARSLSSEIQPVSDSSDSDSPGAMTEPVPVEFVPVDVIAEGRMELGVSGVENGQWVVTVGQDLISEGREQARIRTMSWERIFELQRLQREDLLRDIMQDQNEASNNVTL